MNNNLKNAIIVILLAVIAGLVLYFVPRAADNKNDDGINQADIHDFLTCAEAGYPIMESYPQQCRTPDGRLFVEDITENADVVINTPANSQVVSSPLTVSGKAKGNWFFEANLPVTLKDTNGKVLAQKGAQAQGEWMTTDYVNFTVVLEFERPETEDGVLLIQKDNPSGDPERDSEFAVPVRFR